MPGGAVQPRKQLDAWQEWAKQRGARGLGVRAGRRGRRARRPGRQEPLGRRSGPGLPAHVGAQPGRLRVLRRRRGRRRSRALLGAARLRDRPALRADRRVGVVVPVGRRRAAVRAGRRGASGDVAVGAARGPRCTTRSRRPSRSGSDTFDSRPGRGAGLRLRHRLQRQRDRRRVDPYPPPRRPGAGLRRDGPHRGGGAGEVRLPARRLRVRRRRRTAASRSAGTGSARCCPAPTRSAR